MRRITGIMLVLSFILAGIAFAASQSFTFNLTNSGTTSYVYMETSNTKLYVDDDATIKCVYTDAPGYGYRVGLCNMSNVQATECKWYSTNGRTRNHAFLDGKAIANTDYRIFGRIDNDYYGTYIINGKYNADDVSIA